MVIPSGIIGKDSTSHGLHRKRGDRVFRYPQTGGKFFFQLNDVKRDYSPLMAWTLLQQRPPVRSLPTNFSSEQRSLFFISF